MSHKSRIYASVAGAGRRALIEIIENHTGKVITVEWARSPSDPGAWAADIATKP